MYKYGGGAGSKQAMLVLVFKRDRILGYHVGTGRKPNGIICLGAWVSGAALWLVLVFVSPFLSLLRLFVSKCKEKGIPLDNHGTNPFASISQLYLRKAAEGPASGKQGQVSPFTLCFLVCLSDCVSVTMTACSLRGQCPSSSFGALSLGHLIVWS